MIREVVRAMRDPRRGQGERAGRRGARRAEGGAGNGWRGWALLGLPLALGGCDAGPAVVEIGQLCATTTGCLAADEPGFPVQLDRRGRYRLVGDLIVPDADTDAIRVAADDVRLDLAGFEITTARCRAAGAACAPEAGTGAGVVAVAPGIVRTELSDGRIVGLGRHGVELAGASRVQRISARANGGDGIVVGAGSWVADCEAWQNAGAGLRAAAESVVSGSRAIGNGGAGIEAGREAFVHHNAIAHNAGPALRLAESARHADNTLELPEAFEGPPVIGGIDEGGNRCLGAGCR